MHIKWIRNYQGRIYKFSALERQKMPLYIGRRYDIERLLFQIRRVESPTLPLYAVTSLKFTYSQATFFWEQLILTEIIHFFLFLSVSFQIIKQWAKNTKFYNKINRNSLFFIKDRLLKFAILPDTSTV